jgi:hypothetical protein
MLTLVQMIHFLLIAQPGQVGYAEVEHLSASAVRVEEVGRVQAGW